MTPPSSLTQTPLLQARRHFTSGRFEQALQLIETTLNQHPQDVRTLIQCAQTFGYCYEISRAEQLLERALAVDSAAARTQVALAFHQIFRPAKAIAILEELRANQQLPLPDLAQLAKLYEQSNRQTEAIAALNECVSLAPSQPQPKVLLARLLRQAGKLHDAEDLLSRVVSGGAPAATLVHAWSEWAVLRDQQGDFNQAVEAIEEAKSLLRAMPDVQQQAKQSVAISQAFEKLYSRVDKTVLQEWYRAKLADLDTSGVAHLLGFPRSGTTLLEQVLDAHPRIHSASERAVFSKAIFPAMAHAGQNSLSLEAIQNCPVGQLHLLRQRYVQAHESIAGHPLSDRVLVDKNPNHTSLLVGLYRLLPESKFVFALRDPRDVVVSTYMRFFSLSEFSASYLTWESTCELYAHEMNVWLKMRSVLPKNWIEVKYEDMVADLEATARRVIALLGVPWDEGMMDYRDDQRKYVHSPTHAEVRKPVYRSSVGRWQNYEQHLAPHLDRLKPYLAAFGYD